MEIKSGGVLLSHAAARVVPSTLEGLTTEFGMGSGVFFYLILLYSTF
jgi:hypothetical protein